MASSRSHNYSLLLKLLPFRGQDMDIVHKKFRKTISKIIRSNFEDQDTNPNGVAVLTFDNTTRVHKALEFVIKKGYSSISLAPPSFVYKSLPRVMELLCSKRRDITRIRAHLEEIPDY